MRDQRSISLGCLLGLLFALLCLSDGAWSDDPLPVDDAFQLSAERVDASQIRVQVRVAPEYYLYRDRIKLSSLTPGVDLQAPQIPKGMMKLDALFGEVEVLRGSFPIDALFSITAGQKTLQLQVQYQGCADMGVCYPPQTRQFDLTLSEQNSGPNALGKLFDSVSSGLSQLGLGWSEQELLPPDEAFHFFAESRDAQTISLNWQIADGYYLYRDKVSVQLNSPKGASLGNLDMPPGEEKSDPTFGNTRVFHLGLEALQTVRLAQSGVRNIELSVGYQGCAERGVCYPPMSKNVTILMPVNDGDEVSEKRTETNAPTPVKQSEQDRLARAMSQDSIWLTVLSFFGFGLLLAFTPCIFPMIPILSGIIVGHGHEITTRKALTLSLAYVLASALTYTVFGVLAGLFGSNLQAAFQNPWIIGAFSVLFVVLALAMFGLFQLQLPDRFRSRLAQANQTKAAGTPAGAATMGVLSTLIVGPCVAPPLAGALIYIGQTGDALLGGAALFALGLGMGAPLILIGTSAGKLLPKAGMWMESVKAIFGVLLLMVAIWLLDRIVPHEVTMLLSAVLLIVCAVFLKVLDSLSAQASSRERLAKGFGLILLVYGLVLMVGASVGGGHILHPLRGLSADGNVNVPAHGLPFRSVQNRQQLNQALQEAEVSKQWVMLDFYADWCVSCKEMEAFTFSDPKVQARLSNALLLQIDVTDNNAEHQAILKQFGLIGPPAILFFPPGREEQRAYRVVGYMPANQFGQHLQAVSTCVKTAVC